MTPHDVPDMRERIAALYDAYAARLRVYVRGLVGDRHLADDLVQETFVAIAEQLAAGNSITHMPTYLYTTARHAAFAVSRRRGRARRALEALSADPTLFAPTPGAEDPWRHEDLTRALAQLPEPQREVVLLKIWGGCTFAEIATVVRTSPNTAASRYRYAVDKLRRALEKDART